MYWKRWTSSFVPRRDAARWEVVRRKERTVVTLFGVVRVNRRLYRDRATGAPRWLLDEAMGRPARERISPAVQELATDLAVRMPFGEAAGILE